MEENTIQNKAIPKYDRPDYIEFRKQYIESIVRSSNLIDKTLITLASATIGGSFVYLTSGKEILNNKCLLVISWIFLGLTFLLVLCSFYLSEQTNQKALDKFDEEYTLPKGQTNRKIKELECEIYCGNIRIKRLKWFPIITLTAGVLFLALFVFYNI